MGRKRKGPWKRKSNGCWYTTEPGSKKYVKLAAAGESYQTALERYHDYHAAFRRAEPGPTVTVAQLIDEFLEWCHHHRKKRTFEWYRDHLVRFHRHAGSTLLVSNLKPYHVERWLQADYEGQSANYRRGAIRTIQRVMNWAVTSGYIQASPIKHIEKPRQEAREVVISDEQFRRMLEITTDQRFRDYLEFIRESGCRPQEIRVIEARHFDGEKIILERRSSKGERYSRVIYLPPRALEIIKRLVEEYPAGALFRNSRDEPWGKNSVRCRFRVLKRELDMPELCATALRHTWATDVLQKGKLDTTTASILMGHRDPATLARNYQHLTQNHEFLIAAARRARDGATDGGSQSS